MSSRGQRWSISHLIVLKIPKSIFFSHSIQTSRASLSQWTLFVHHYLFTVIGKASEVIPQLTCLCYIRHFTGAAAMLPQGPCYHKAQPCLWLPAHVSLGLPSVCPGMYFLPLPHSFPNFLKYLCRPSSAGMAVSLQSITEAEFSLQGWVHLLATVQLT